jgi:ribonuclease Z
VKADATALDAGGLKVTAILVDHGPVKPAYGYRFDYGGHSVTVSGDTVADQNLAHAAAGSDVLVHEALNPELVGILETTARAAGRPRPAKIMHDIPGYHTSPVDAARIANQAHARLLVYTHLLPVLPNAIAERAFLRGVSDVRPDGVVLGHDGLLVRVTKDGIEQSTLH